MNNTKRYVALDVLRGVTVAFMCIVNNPGSWSHVFAPLRHSPWNGCTPTDLVAPFFIFCVGCAMAFSLSKFDGLNMTALKKIIGRGIALFVIGLLLNMFPFFPMHPHNPDTSFWQNWVYWLGHVRVTGILQHIAMAYMIAGVLALWLRNQWKIVVAIISLLAIYTGILIVFGQEPGPFTLAGNVTGRIDSAIVGANHIYHGYHLESGKVAVFDPEGFLGGLSAACTALIGYLAGCLILETMRKRFEYQENNGALDDGMSWRRFCHTAWNLSWRQVWSIEGNTSSSSHTVVRLFVNGVFLFAAGVILNIWIPVCKPLWSASYVLFSGGLAMLSLGLLSFIIDVFAVEKPFSLFRIMGTNALMAFVLSVLLVKIPSMAGFSPSAYFGANEYMSLLWAVLFTSVIFLCQWLLYRKNIIIKL